LDCYIRFGMVDSEAGVILKCRKPDEAVSPNFAARGDSFVALKETHPFSLIYHLQLVFHDADGVTAVPLFQRLSYISPSLPVHFILASPRKPAFPLHPPRKEVAHSTWSTMDDAGHLIVLEKPEGIAKEIGEVVKRQLGLLENRRPRL